MKQTGLGWASRLAGIRAGSGGQGESGAEERRERCWPVESARSGAVGRAGEPRGTGAGRRVDVAEAACRGRVERMGRRARRDRPVGRRGQSGARGVGPCSRGADWHAAARDVQSATAGSSEARGKTGRIVGHGQSREGPARATGEMSGRGWNGQIGLGPSSGGGDWGRADETGLVSPKCGAGSTRRDESRRQEWSEHGWSRRRGTRRGPASVGVSGGPGQRRLGPSWTVVKAGLGRGAGRARRGSSRGRRE